MLSRRRGRDRRMTTGTYYQMDATGKVVVVTGGSRGIGQEIAKAFMERGAAVAIADILYEEDHKVRSGEDRPGFLELRTDITDEDSVARCFEQVRAAFGTVDILVNNAGIMYKDPVEQTDLAKWNRIVEVNLTGAMLCAKKAVPLMKKQRWGRIINISSMMAQLGAETHSAYCATKAGLHQLTKVWAAECAPYGITVNSICPGWVYTPMVVKFIERLAHVHQIDMEEALRKIFSLIPQRRFLDPAEIAFAALFLASELAKGVSGTAIFMDTGLSSTMPLGIHSPVDKDYGMDEVKRVLSGETPSQG